MTISSSPYRKIGETLSEIVEITWREGDKRGGETVLMKVVRKLKLKKGERAMKKTIVVLIVIGLFAGLSYASDKGDSKALMAKSVEYAASQGKEQSYALTGASNSAAKNDLMWKNKPVDYSKMYISGNNAAYGNFGEGWE
jgi:hypothetical protein